MLARHFEAQPGSDSLLVELHRAHDFIIQALDWMSQLMGSSRPAQAVLREARLTLDRASIRRELLWADILHFLSPRVGRLARSELQRLQEIDIDLIRALSEHARAWTAETIFGDWAGYCEAWQVMRGKMIAAMETERRILYPLLRNVATQPLQIDGVDGRRAGRPPSFLRFAK